MWNMQRRTIYIILVFLGGIISFLGTYQLLLHFLDNEDGISITLIASSSPHWAYFIDGYDIVYTTAWIIACMLFWFFCSPFLRPIRRNTKLKHRVYTVSYNIILYFLGLYMVSKLTVGGMNIHIIPFVVAMILFGIVYVVYRTADTWGKEKK